MVQNPIYEGPMYETILQQFRPIHLPLGPRPSNESTNESLEIRYYYNPLSLEGYQQNALGVETKESIRGQEDQTTTVLPDSSSQVNEDEYTVMQSPVVKDLPTLQGE